MTTLFKSSEKYPKIYGEIVDITFTLLLALLQSSLPEKKEDRLYVESNCALSHSIIIVVIIVSMG